MLYITVGCYTKEENKVENIPQCKKKTLEIPPRSILRFHTGKEMKKLFNSQIELLQESNFDLMWVGLWLVGLGLHFWSVQAWFCIVQLSPSLLLKLLPLSLTHTEGWSRCPRWFGVLENPLMTLLSWITLHQGKGVAPHSEAPGDRTWKYFSRKIWGWTCFPSCAQASETPRRSSRDRTLNPPGKRWASPQSCLHQRTCRRIHIQRSLSIKPLNEDMTRSFKISLK